MVLSLAFILALIGSATGLVLGVLVFTEVSDVISIQEFSDVGGGINFLTDNESNQYEVGVPVPTGGITGNLHQNVAEAYDVQFMDLSDKSYNIVALEGRASHAADFPNQRIYGVVLSNVTLSDMGTQFLSSPHVIECLSTNFVDASLLPTHDGSGGIEPAIQINFTFSGCNVQGSPIGVGIVKTDADGPAGSLTGTSGAGLGQASGLYPDTTDIIGQSANLVCTPNNVPECSSGVNDWSLNGADLKVNIYEDLPATQVENDGFDELTSAKDTAWAVIGILPVALFFGLFAIFQGLGLGGRS